MHQSAEPDSLLPASSPLIRGVRVCVFTCASVWLNRTVFVWDLVGIQDAQSESWNPMGLGVGTGPYRWLLPHLFHGRISSAPPVLAQFLL